MKGSQENLLKNKYPELLKQFDHEKNKTNGIDFKPNIRR